ncbi:hypothetical protein GQ600_15361 [Phytophthora cactorum]|nr:hypothetical protein GQ600_15361 [Phytophthora cactorum]
MISSRSTKFEHHPAIIARVFDIQFGVRGLSVMHLTRLRGDAKAQKHNLWMCFECTNGSHVFAEKFFDHHTCRLISSAPVRRGTARFGLVEP